MMNEVLLLPGRGSTSFFFTQMDGEGFSREQQRYIYALIRSYRERYPLLEITEVLDFGMEEGTPYESTERGAFRDCRDLAVFNNATLSIAYNHIRVSRMPPDISAEERNRILQEYVVTREISGRAARTQDKLRSEGLPPAQIRAQMLADAAQYWENLFPAENAEKAGNTEKAGSIEKTENTEKAEIAAKTENAEKAENAEYANGESEPDPGRTGCRRPALPSPGPHNLLPLEDPFFADVRAIRQLEESMSIRRLTVHELGHALADAYGILKDRRIRKLFAACRDGFEDRDEFCAECFMASELTDAIPLANEVAAVIRERAGR